MVSSALQTVTAERLGFRRLLGINAFWFGGGAHWQPISISLLPVGAILVAGSAPELVGGRATGLLGTMNQVGTVVGVGLVGVVLKQLGSTRSGLVSGYAVIAVILLASLAVTVRTVREAPTNLTPRPATRPRPDIPAAAVV